MPKNNESSPETVSEQERRLSLIDLAGIDINLRKEEVESDYEDVNYDYGDTDESKGVRSVQEAINLQHPFGIKLWKPALYKKDRSILVLTPF
jgi:Ca2+:H+ antiporter